MRLVEVFEHVECVNYIVAGPVFSLVNNKVGWWIKKALWLDLASCYSLVVVIVVVGYLGLSWNPRDGLILGEVLAKFL